MDRKIKKTLKPEEYSREYYCLKYGNEHADLPENKVENYLTALKYLKSRKGEKILDIGCGKGDIIKECTETGAYVIGIDYSMSAGKLSKENGNENIILASATHLPFNNDIFDKITFMEVIEHMDDNDIGRSLLEIKRVLNDRGYVFASTPNSWSWIINILSLKTMYREDPYHINVKNPLQLSKIFKDNGFHIKIINNLEYSPGYPVWKKALRKLLYIVLHIRFIAYKSDCYI